MSARAEGLGCFGVMILVFFSVLCAGVVVEAVQQLDAELHAAHVIPDSSFHTRGSR